MRGEIVLSGEVSAKLFRDALLDSLRRRTTYTYVDSILVLPEAQVGLQSYGIVYVAVAHMRRQPRHSAELVTQTLLGTVLRLYKKEGGFYLSQNWDRYLGWVSAASMVEVDSAAAAAWSTAPRVVCVENYAVMRSGRTQRSDIVTDLVAGATLKKIGQSGNWLRVETPDGRRGYVEKRHVVDEESLNAVSASAEDIVAQTKQYLGIGYLWGGTSTFGFDCSGLAQTAYRMHNIRLPRDTNQMVKEGKAVEAGENFENLVPGDLVFFGAPNSRVTHVGIYIGDREFIHADGWVHVNSFDPAHPLYNRYRHERYKTARRIVN